MDIYITFPGRMEKHRVEPYRGRWASKREYLLVIAGAVVGLGNVWRFPYLCAFLVPYGLLVVVWGIPQFLLETSPGQYAQEGYVTCWRKLCPLAQVQPNTNLMPS
uniref:Transporter n=1 Tax=Mola mola TaxID=94237 RepID=A0A3Q4BBH4_MOLML